MDKKFALFQILLFLSFSVYCYSRIIIKDKVEDLMESEDRQNRYSYDVLQTNIEKHLKILKMTRIFLLIYCAQ